LATKGHRSLLSSDDSQRSCDRRIKRLLGRRTNLLYEHALLPAVIMSLAFENTVERRDSEEPGSSPKENSCEREGNSILQKQTNLSKKPGTAAKHEDRRSMREIIGGP
jgi:hypothetical protein